MSKMFVKKKGWRYPRESRAGKNHHVKEILSGISEHWKHKVCNVGNWSQLRKENNNLPRHRKDAYSGLYIKQCEVKLLLISFS